MKIKDLLSLSTRMFKTRKMRTFLTILGVGVGIGTVLFLVSLGYGLQNVILNQITTADSLLSLDVNPGTSGLIELDRQALDRIDKTNNVVELSPIINLPAQISLGELTGDGLVYAVDPSYFRLGGISPAIGSFFDSASSYDLVVSSAGVKLFNLEPEEIINKQVELTLFLSEINEEGFEETVVVKRNRKYTIRGVVDDDNTNYVFLPIKTIDDLNIEIVNQLKVKVDANENMESVRDEIIGMGFIVSSLSDTIEQANKIFRVIQIVLALFGLVALIVSAIGMFNTMTIALLERTNEIGIMRSIGASRGDIKVLFLVESFFMGFLGGLGGVIIGYLAGEVTNLGVNLLARRLGGVSLDLFFHPYWFIAVIIIFSSFIGFFTGVYPAHRAAKLNPLDALRYK